MENYHFFFVRSQLYELKAKQATGMKFVRKTYFHLPFSRESDPFLKIKKIVAKLNFVL